MTPEQTAHLSQEALNDVLIGLASPESEAHLALCAHCRDQVHQFNSDLEIFNRTSLAWSEARPSAPLHLPSKSNVRKVMNSPLTWALATALLIMAGLSEWRSDLPPFLHQPSATDSANSRSGSSDSEAQIAQDNELLRTVNVALNTSEKSPINEFQLLEEPASRVRTRPALNHQ